MLVLDVRIIVKEVDVILDAVNISVGNTSVCLYDTASLIAINNFAAYNTITSWDWTPTNNILRV